MNVQEWLDNPKTIQKSKKGYAHFDYRIDITKAAEFIKNPENVAHYGFYPFIHYTMKMINIMQKLGKNLKKEKFAMRLT